MAHRLAISIVVVALAAAACTASSQPPPENGPAFAELPEFRVADGVLRARLIADETSVTVDGRTFTALTFNGGLTGPTLRLSSQDRLELELVNRLDEATNLHFHGAHVSPNGLSDDSSREIGPGETGRYEVSFAGVMPGTLWYHAHVHGSVDEQISGGLSGVLIVDPAIGELAPKLGGITEHIFALKGVTVQGGAAVPSSEGVAVTQVVNDLRQPMVDLAPGEVQLWRLANVGPDTWYRLRLDGHRFQVVIEDGQPVWDVWSAEELVLPPGKRFDVLIQAEKRGSYALRTLAYEQGARTYPEEVLAVARVGGDRVPSIPIPNLIAPRSEDLSGDPVSAKREFTLTEDQAADTFSINGHVFEHHHAFGEAAIYTVEQWTIRNATQEQHPFHLHTDYFQVVSVNGVPYDAHGRQDTVIVPIGGEVVIRPAFYDFRGTVLFHCHILAHEDGGMMGEVTVG